MHPVAQAASAPRKLSASDAMPASASTSKLMDPRVFETMALEQSGIRALRPPVTAGDGGENFIRVAPFQVGHSTALSSLPYACAAVSTLASTREAELMVHIHDTNLDHLLLAAYELVKPECALALQM